MRRVLVVLVAIVLGACGRIGFDARPNGADAGLDASVDASMDARVGDVGGDAPADTGLDAALDAPPDASEDAGPPLHAPTLRFPWNGYTTGSVHAGLLVIPHPLQPYFTWDVVAGAAQYQVQVDDRCSVEGFATCIFPTPEVDVLLPSSDEPFLVTGSLPVSTEPPVGRRYYWRVRACDATARCGEWSEVRYLDVGRLRDDLNGDGFSDLVAGAPGLTNGEVGVFYGPFDVLGPVVAAQRILPFSPSPADRFGAAVAIVGDTNADGFADLAIGAPLWDRSPMFVDEGRAEVHYGGAAGISTAIVTELTAPGRAEDTGPIWFGYSVAHVGDTNGDGYADVLVGAYQQDLGTQAEGAAFLFRGTSVSVDSEAASTLDSPTGDDFGFCGVRVAGGGDLNGDGLTDFAVACSNVDDATSRGGLVALYRGLRGIVAEPRVADRVVVNPTGRAAESFGLGLALDGDLDPDNVSDLVIGAPFAGVGRFYVYRGARDFFDALPVPETFLNPIPSPNAYFGATVAYLGDHDGDFASELAVGANFYPDLMMGLTYGRVDVYATLLGLSLLGSFAHPESTTQGRYGSALARVTDPDGAGASAMLVGAFATDLASLNEVGAVYLHRGLTVGPPAWSTTVRLELRNPLVGNAQFGASVD